MAFPFKHSKREFDRSSLDQDGKGKRQKTAQNPGATVFRILCPATKSGSIIGKGGGIITKIRQETGAKIRIDEIIPGCEERVVVITGPDREIEDKKEDAKKDDDTSVDDADEGDATNEKDENVKESENLPEESSKSEKTISAAQRALLLVFERIAEGDSESDSVDDESKKTSVVARILILSTQVGCILGKGGSVVKQLASESGAHIRILPRDKVPSCASPMDELVQITGSMEAVRKALQSVSQQLIENPPRERDILHHNRVPGSSSRHFDQGPPFPSRPYEMLDFHPHLGPPVSKFQDISRPVNVPVSPEILTFQMICSCEKVGNIIGKGGNIVRVIQNETSSEIKIAETTPDSEDRIVVISGPALPDDRVSPVQDAVLRVQSRIAMSMPEDKDATVSTRVIVPSTQTGCLIGRGGSIVTEMRKLSGAHIRILTRDLSPTYTSDNEVVVQVSGKFEAVQEALLQITTKLKQHTFNEKLSFLGRRELSPPEPNSHFFRRLHPFDPVRVLPHADYGPGFPSHGGDRIPPAFWASRGIGSGDGSVGIDDYERAPKRRFNGFSGGIQPDRIPMTTIDVIVPRALIPVIRGEDDGCLKEICQISGANVSINDSGPGASETVVMVSGMPDQIHAAQSLIEAFVRSESRTS